MYMHASKVLDDAQTQPNMDFMSSGIFDFFKQVFKGNINFYIVLLQFGVRMMMENGVICLRWSTVRLLLSLPASRLKCLDNN